LNLLDCQFFDYLLGHMTYLMLAVTDIKI
jgi:hypothetical protein